MTKMSGEVEYPKWAPAELCEYHKNWVADHPDLVNEGLLSLERLITDERMKPIWGKLEGLAKKKNINNYVIDIYMLVQNTEGPYGAEKLTKAELRRAVQDIEKKSLELTSLIDEVMPFAFVNNAPKSLDNLVIDVIKSLGPQARQILYEPRALGNPNLKKTGNSKRNYFVRKLSAYFRDTFGKPMNDLVAEMHSIFLPEAKDNALGADNVASIKRKSPL
ncbi:MAG: hypothetical protein ABFS45_12215 [Pseudomonadota bacterium]